MTRGKIAELKDHLSKHLRAVEAGAEITVTDRDRPIARIVPVVVASPTIVLLEPTGDFGDVRDRKRTRAAWAISSTDLLLEERAEGERLHR